MSAGIYTDGQHDLLRFDPRFRRLSRARWVNKFGRNPLIPATTDQTIWYKTGTYVFPFPPGAFSGNLVSTSINDVNLTGTFAWSVLVQGLNANWDEISETVLLNGQTPVPLTNSYSRINRMQVLNNGDNQVTAPDGDIELTIGGFTAAFIGAGRGQTEQAIYTIPRNTRAYMTQYYYSMNKLTGGTTESDMSLKIRSLAGDTPENNPALVKHTQGVRSSAVSQLRHPFDPPFVIDGPCDVWITAENTSSANTDISAGFDMVLADK